MVVECVNVCVHMYWQLGEGGDGGEEASSHSFFLKEELILVLNSSWPSRGEAQKGKAKNLGEVESGSPIHCFSLQFTPYLSNAGCSQEALPGHMQGRKQKRRLLHGAVWNPQPRITIEVQGFSDS